MKNLLFTLCFILGFVLVGIAQSDSSEFKSVIIRIEEEGNFTDNSFFIISVVNPKNEYELKEFNNRSKQKVNRHIEVKKELDYWYKKGFKIENVSSISRDNSEDGLTTYYLIKED